MARTLHLLPLLLAHATIAQPVLNVGDIATLPGDSFLYHASSVQPTSTAGANQTWDFTTLDTDSLIPIVFADPDTTPDGASYPSATIAAYGGDSLYSYTGFDATGGYYWGLSVPGGSPIVYSDPMQWASFPATYGTSWTDNFDASFTVIGFPVTRTGTIDANADGWGTMIMPYGTLTDVLRVSYVEDYTDASLVNLVTHREYTYYLKAGTRYPIVEQYEITTTVLGNTNTVSGMSWMEVDISTGLPTAAAPNEASVYPVPANDAITVQLPFTSTPGTVDLVDAQGRVVLSRTVNTATLVLPVDALEPGAYALRVRLNGSASTHHVVVE